jgi:hypothetical protein
MPEVTDREELMATFSPARSAGVWLRYNATLDLLSRRGLAITRVRYEALVRGSEAEFRSLAAGIDLPACEMDRLAGPSVAVGVQHTVAGNPSRFASGRVVLKPDEEWRTRMSVANRVTVSLLTWPLLWRYGYRPSAAI